MNFPKMERIAEEEEDLGAEKDYSRLIGAIKKIDVNANGIKFKVQAKYILGCWQRDCLTEIEVMESLDAIHDASSVDADIIRKLVKLLNSQDFYELEIREIHIRRQFRRKLIEEAEGIDDMQSTNPQRFRNNIQLMGEIYHKTRLINRKRIISLTMPLMESMELLLNSKSPVDLQVFTKQIHMNAMYLEEACFFDMMSLMNKVRQIAGGFDTTYPKECRLLLLLALELYGTKYDMIPASVQHYYAKELGEDVMAFFKV